MTDSLHYRPRLDRQRQPARPSLWVLLIAGSVLMHLLLLLLLHQWLLRSIQVERSAAPISVEFVEPARPAAGTNRATRPVVSQTASAPASRDRPAVIAPASPTIPRTVLEPPLPQRSPVAPTRVSPRRSPPRQVAPAREKTPPATRPPLRTNQPDLPTTEVARGTDRPGTGNPATATGQPSQTPAESGTILPGPQGGEMVVELIQQQQVQDFKQQQARARQVNRQLSIYYPVKPAQPIEIEAHLDIGAQGEVLGVLNVRVLDSGGATVEPEMLTNLARQVFRDWSFTPAQDGTPPQPVRSDLMVQARITVL